MTCQPPELENSSLSCFLLPPGSLPSISMDWGCFQALFRAEATRACEARSTQEGGDWLYSVRPPVGEDNRKCYISFSLLSFKQIRALKSEQIPFYIWSCCLFCICNLHLKWPWCVLGNKPSNKHVPGWLKRAGMYSVLWIFVCFFEGSIPIICLLIHIYFLTKEHEIPFFFEGF